MRRWSYINLWFLKHLCGLEYTVVGLEHIPNNQPMIVVTAHQSAWETFVIQTILPYTCFVLKRELLWIPFFGLGMYACHPISIKRSSPKQALKNLIDQGLDRLRRGAAVIIYPEGTRKAIGKPGKFSVGGAMLAMKADVPMLLMAHNAGAFWGRREIKKKAGCIQVVFGKPLYPKDYKDARAMNTEAEKWMHAQLKNLPIE